MSAWKPDIYDYLDYRAWLGDYYAAGKANQPGFSYRWFSRRAGFASSNFLKLVIDGRRNLGTDSVDKIALAVGLTGDEHRFFAELVALAQADTAAEKTVHMERIATTRRFLEARPLHGDLFEYLSHWYNVAIRELAAREDFRDDPAWIAAQLQPEIPAARAGDALEVLLRLGLLERSDGGRVVRGEPTLDAGHEVEALGVRRFHLEMLERAGESIDTVEPARRDISAMTVCVRADTVAELKQRLRDFREQFIGLCDSQDAPDQVYQVNIQFFPLSKPADPDS